MLKGIVNGVEKEITRIPMLVNGTYKEGWEIRDSSDRLIWGYNSTISGTSPLSFKGGGTALTDYSIIGNLSQSGGTPSPTNPIYPSETGDLVASGDHAGEYAIPITCGGTTQTIYLQEPIRKIGEYVDVAGLSIGGAKRRIKKLVLTGEEEGWKTYTVGNYRFYYLPIEGSLAFYSAIFSNYFLPSNVPGASRPDNSIRQTVDNDVGTINIRCDAYGSLEVFKQLLSDQYSAGTPVTVWYVLASETTETTTMPQITAAKGSNTLSIGTTLPPSSVSITGHIRSS